MFTSKYFTRKRIRIGTWANIKRAWFSEKVIKEYVECGLDFLVSMTNMNEVEEYRDMLIEMCDKYGVELYLHDELYSDPAKITYKNHPSYTGHYICDEPGSDQFDELSALANTYIEKTGKEPFINLLPMYANAAQFKFGANAAAIEYYDADPDLFRKYCESYCQKFNTSYICTDIYPLNNDNGKKTTYRDYIESINIIASVAREYNRQFWCYIQTFGWNSSKRTPNEEEFRWQTYSMLSFGCTNILLWHYAGQDDEFPSLLDFRGEPTKTYYDAQKVFEEVKSISDTYVEYNNVGAFTLNCSDKTPYLKMSNPYNKFKAATEISCPDPLLVGCFEKDGGSAFTIVNMTELMDERSTTVTFKSEGKVTAYPKGLKTELASENGKYTVNLEYGQGMFITIA